MTVHQTSGKSSDITCNSFEKWTIDGHEGEGCVLGRGLGMRSVPIAGPIGIVVAGQAAFGQSRGRPAFVHCFSFAVMSCSICFASRKSKVASMKA